MRAFARLIGILLLSAAGAYAGGEVDGRHNQGRNFLIGLAQTTREVRHGFVTARPAEEGLTPQVEADLRRWAADTGDSAAALAEITQLKKLAGIAASLLSGCGTALSEQVRARICLQEVAIVGRSFEITEEREIATIYRRYARKKGGDALTPARRELRGQAIRTVVRKLPPEQRQGIMTSAASLGLALGKSIFEDVPGSGSAQPVAMNFQTGKNLDESLAAARAGRLAQERALARRLARRPSETIETLHLPTSIDDAEAAEFTQFFRHHVDRLNREGLRRNDSGYTSGITNNVMGMWSRILGRDNESSKWLRCYDQAEHLQTALRDGGIIDGTTAWKSRIRTYERVAPESKLSGLLNNGHWWLQMTHPDGRVVEMDPWINRMWIIQPDGSRREMAGPRPAPKTVLAGTKG